MRAEILKLLKANPHTYVSGEALIKATGISRQGVWKHIQALIDEGYLITSTKGQGYRLESSPVRLTQTQMDALVSDYPFIEKAYHFDSIGSTNAFLKEHAKRVSTALAVADEQTAGRGRLGRAWASAKAEGLWMSLLLRPPIQPVKASMLTQVVAVSMVKALSVFKDITISIKWPNDLWIGEQKVCGILTEMASELHAIEYVVVGIGLNLTQAQFPEELSQVATSLNKHTNTSISRLELIQRFLECFSDDYNQFIEDGDLSAFVPFLNEKAYLNGHTIWISDQPQADYRAIGVNVMGELIIEDSDGNQKGLTYGEVSVRRKSYALGI